MVTLYESYIPNLATGLAETAVHHAPPGFLEPLFLFTEDPNLNTSPKPPVMGDPHALTILARVLRDTELVSIPKDWKETTLYSGTVKKYAKEIATHVKGWNMILENLGTDGRRNLRKSSGRLLYFMVLLDGQMGGIKKQVLLPISSCRSWSQSYRLKLMDVS